MVNLHSDSESSLATWSEATCPAVGSTYRTLGLHSSWERIGCGVMDKRRRSADHIAYHAPTYSVIWILVGHGEYQDASGAVYQFKSGDCFHRWPGRWHSTSASDQQGWVEFFVDCGPGLHHAFAQANIIRPDPPVWTPQTVPLEALSQLRDDLTAANEGDLAQLSLRVWQLIVDAHASKAGDHNHDLIAEACRLLADEALVRGDLRSWCAAQDLEYETFRKQFTKRMGEPPGQYRIRRRMERACSLLLAGNSPIAAVAEELGYHSPYEFSAQFKRRFGMSPKQYRQQPP